MPGAGIGTGETSGSGILLDAPVKNVTAGWGGSYCYQGWPANSLPPMGEQVTDISKLEALIAAASASGGAERANYQLFIERLCSALGLPGPDMAREENALNDYVFERRIDFKHPHPPQPRLMPSPAC